MTRHVNNRSMLPNHLLPFVWCMLGCAIVAGLWAPIRTENVQDSALVFVADGNHGEQELVIEERIVALLESSDVRQAIRERSVEGLEYDIDVFNPESSVGAVFVTVFHDDKRLAGRIAYEYARVTADTYNAQTGPGDKVLGFREADLFTRAPLWNRHRLLHAAGGAVLGAAIAAAVSQLTAGRKPNEPIHQSL